MLRLAAYLRDSGGERQENSTDRQLAEIQDWALRTGAVIEQVFRDEARPGSSVVGRDAFQEMIHVFRSGCELAGLVIWSWSRFAREINDAQFYRADLRRRGFELYSVSDPIPDGPMGRFIEAAIDWKNEQFLIDLSKDVKSGLADLVRDHGAVPGTPPKGFRREPVQIGGQRNGGQRLVHRWVPDPDVAPLVLRAFEMKAAGASLREIKAATGLYKSVTSFEHFFSNRIYIGILEFGGQTIDDYCEPLVPSDVWHAVQVAKRQKLITDGGKNHPRRAASPYLLSGLVHCARCGTFLSGLTRVGHRSYACSHQRRRYDCDLQPIPAQILEDLIQGELAAFLGSPGLLTAERDRLHARMEGERDTLSAELAAQRHQLAGVRAQIGRLADAIAEAGHSRALITKLTELEGAESERLTEIARLERLLSAGSLDQTDDELADLAAANCKALERADPDQLQAILRGLVKEITVDRQGRELLGSITWYYPPPDVKKKETVPIVRAPMGAPRHRHSFSRAFQVTVKLWERKKKP